MNPELVEKVLAKFAEDLPRMMRRAQKMVRLVDKDVRRALEDFGYKYVPNPRARYNEQRGEWVLENQEKGMDLYYVQALAGGGQFGLFLRVGTRGGDWSKVLTLAHQVICQCQPHLRVQIQTSAEGRWEDYQAEVYPTKTWDFWISAVFCGSVACLIAFCISRRKMRKKAVG